MVQGVMVCGTFLTKNGLVIAASLSVATLLIGIITLSVGAGRPCYYYNDDFGYPSYCGLSALTINGIVLIGMGVLFLVVVGALACKMKDISPSTRARPQLNATPNVFPGQAATHPPLYAPYPQANMGYPQQYPADALPQIPMSLDQQTTQPSTAASGYPPQDPAGAMPQKPISPP